MLDSLNPPTELSAQELKYWYLFNNELFFKVAAQDIDWLSKVAHLEKLPKGELIYLPGEQAKRIYILKQGRVRISRMSPEGKQITLTLLAAGTLFGEISLLEEGSEHENIAEAIEDTWLCSISKEDFLAFMHKHPELNYRIMKLVGTRLRQIENRLEDLLFMSVEQRLQKLLRKLADEYGQQTPDGIVIGLKMTHEEIGHLINATRPTVTEMLQKLQNQDMIRIIKRRIMVLPSLASPV
ncbi:MAG TPA: Crp/Fnr family transcriptional regulator [Candidatus Obscuribacterales bacterium]